MPSLDELRRQIRLHTLADEAEIAKKLLVEADMGDDARARARSAAADFVAHARANAKRSGLIDKFLQQYGLSTAEGVTLMRLAEALLRTPDVATADALIRDKVEAGDWAVHRGKSPFPLVNFSTNALMLTAAWLDEVEGNDPARRMIKATKNLLDRVGEPVIRASVAQAMKIMGEHFVLGETIHEAMRRGKPYGARGYSFSFDMLGEAAHTQADADKFFTDYQNAITAIAAHCTDAKTANNPGISVKLSALHPRYEYGKKQRVLSELGDRLRTLAMQARSANMGFNIDAEETDRLDLSLDLIEMMMLDQKLANWAGFGVVVQAYQRRAGPVLDWLAEISRQTGRRIMVRLVKGAYWDGEIKRAQMMGLDSYPVFTRKVMTDLSYLACARKMFANTDVFYPQFATHNALTATSVQEMAKNHHDGPYTDYELQRLHGMGEQLHDNLLKENVRSRIYAPVGGHRELLPYLVRRLLENGANSSFVNQLIDPDLSIDEIVASPVVEVRALAQIANPAIPAPRDLYKDEIPTTRSRNAARGRDLRDPITAKRFNANARVTISAINAHPLTVTPIDQAKTQPICNPANLADVVGTVAEATPDSIDQIMIDARNGLTNWSAVPIKSRAERLQMAADMLEERMDYFMALAVFEAGKTWDDAIAEVREAIDFCRYYATQAEQIIDSDSDPVGVIVCISPWNFPLAIFLGQVSAALAAGNCVIAKPAEQTPLIAYEAIRLLHECGIPKYAVQFVPGAGETLGAGLVAHRGTDGVIFTGSTPVAQAINRTLQASGKINPVLIAETGGINAMIIDSTALLEQAVNDVISSAFQSAGQRCSACRLVCVQDDVADRFNIMLAGAMAELTVGDPSDRSTDVGPAIDDDSKQTIKIYLEKLQGRARLIATTPHPSRTPDDGHFIAPIAFEMSSVDEITREIFGPVLHVVRFAAKDLARTVASINDLGFGLTMGLHTRIDETMHEIVASARIGNIYVNRNQIGAVVGVQPFGGERMSGTGPKAGGPHYMQALRRIATGETQSQPFALHAKPMSSEERDSIEKSQTAFAVWHPADKISNILAQIGTQGDPVIRAAANGARALFDQHFGTVHTLPGPTGESNTLRLKGRGIIVCLGDHPEQGSDQIIADQVLIAIAAGNTVIAPRRAITEKIGSQLARLSDINNLVTLIDAASISETLFLDHRISAVAFEGNSKIAQSLRLHLARREGPICPVISSREPIRFAIERTLTINTTAAGGDVRLLSLEA